MTKKTTLSTIISPEVKKAITRYCKKRGLKLQFVIEQALIEQLEDEIDLEAYYSRRDEERISLEEVIRTKKTKQSA